MNDNWISIEDQMPEMELHNGTVQSEAVLVFTDEGDIGVSLTYEGRDRKVWWDSTEVGGHVTHWIPLPEPPRTS